VIGWKRKLCTVNREFCEDGEVVRWRAIGHREGERENAREESDEVITRSRI